MMNQKSLTENEALSTVVDMLISATETVNLSNIEKFVESYWMYGNDAVSGFISYKTSNESSFADFICNHVGAV